MENAEIKFLEKSDIEILSYATHVANHMSESGIDNIIYCPFEVGKTHQVKDVFDAVKERRNKSLNEVGWQRAFYALVDGKVVGHLDLRGYPIESALHRMKLGLGLDKEFRGQGLSKRLMKACIDWVIKETDFTWIDLYVFSHNTLAYSLYEKFGFKKIGEASDMFRVGDIKICDVHMALNVREALTEDLQK